MAKPEWGIKRHCHACNAKFYDLQKSPIICPKCGTTVDPEMVFKSRRPRTLSSELAATKADPLEAAALLDEGLEVDLDADGEDEALMEDTSDLVEDDDMAEVIEHVDKEEEV